MEDYEKAALESPPPQPKSLYLFRYVEDTFVIWPHGPHKLKDFLQNLTASINPFSSPWKPKVKATSSSWT
jgi:hypothetical protein